MVSECKQNLTGKPLKILESSFVFLKSLFTLTSFIIRALSVQYHTEYLKELKHFWIKNVLLICIRTHLHNTVYA